MLPTNAVEIVFGFLLLSVETYGKLAKKNLFVFLLLQFTYNIILLINM